MASQSAQMKKLAERAVRRVVETYYYPDRPGHLPEAARDAAVRDVHEVLVRIGGGCRDDDALLDVAFQLAQHYVHAVRAT